MTTYFDDLSVGMAPSGKSEGPFKGTEKGAGSICPHCKHKFPGALPAQCPVCLNATEKGVPDTLEYAKAGFVRAVGFGVVMVAVAIPVHFVGLMAALGNAHIVKGLCHSVAAAFVLAGVWLMTGQDPMFLASQRKSAMRARIYAVISTAMWLVLGYFALFTGPGPVIHALTYAVLFVQALLAWELAGFCRYLALRVPDDGLAWSVYTAGCTVALYCVVFIGLRLIGWNSIVFAIILTWPFPVTPVLAMVLMWCGYKALRLGGAILACAHEAEVVAARKGVPRKVKKYEGGIDL